MADNKKLKLQQELAKKLGRGRFMAERVGHKKVIFTPIKPPQRVYVCLVCTQKFENDTERTVHEREFHVRKRGKKALYDFGPGTLKQSFLSCKFCWEKFANPKALTEHLYSSDHLAEEIFAGKFTQIFNNPKNIKFVNGNGGANVVNDGDLGDGELKIGKIGNDIEGEIKTSDKMEIEGTEGEMKLDNLKLNDENSPKTPNNEDPIQISEHDDSLSPPESKKRRVAIKSMTGPNNSSNGSQSKTPNGQTLSETPSRSTSLSTVAKKSDSTPDIEEITSNNLNNCPYCPKKCSDRTMLQLHIKRQHAQKLERQTFYCVIDRSKHHTYEELNNYYITEHLEKNPKKCALMMQSCRMCDMKFQTEYEARKHEYECHEALFVEECKEGDTDFEMSCIFCTFKCNSMLEMYGHEIKCHKSLLPLLRYSNDIIALITAFNCVHCREHFRNDSILLKHQAEIHWFKYNSKSKL